MNMKSEVIKLIIDSSVALVLDGISLFTTIIERVNDDKSGYRHVQAARRYKQIGRPDDAECQQKHAPQREFFRRL